MTRSARALTAIGCLVLGLVTTGCAGTNPTTPGAPSSEYSCLGTPIPAAALEDPRPATELAEQDHPALDGLEVPALDLADWIVVTGTDDTVVLLRELSEPQDRGAGDVRTHERITISVVDAPNIPESPAWMLTAAGECAIVRDLGDLGFGTTTLDPSRPPDPAATQVALLVTEFACNSGEDAAGRVRVVELVETEETVQVAVGIQPRSGGADCQSNPPTPFVLELDAALGTRALLDASVLPARPIALPAD